MKRHAYMVGLLGASMLYGAVATAAERTYVIPVHGMIERGLLYVVRRCVTQARREGAQSIVFDMDTPGGRVDAAEEIINIIGNIDIPTYTFVNPNAISAGAMISMATEHIYMAPGSRIGDAMPIMITMFGSPQELPEALQEKQVSYVAGLIRSAAQRRGHDARLAEAMVRRELEYRVGDDVICPSNQLLTLTNVEAERMVERDGKQTHLLSEGTVPDLKALLQATGQGDNELIEFTITPFEKVARFIELFSILFLVGGLLGIYIEIKTPGFGVPGIAGIALLAIWFWGHHIAGLAGMGEVLVFFVGVVLLGIEIFVIPGFGVVGIAGIGLMVLSLLMAMVQHYPGTPAFEVPRLQIGPAIFNLSGALVISFVLMAVLTRYLPRTQAFQRIVLNQALEKDRGYTAGGAYEEMVGRTGRAVTPLHPAGIAVIDGRRLNVVTRGDFIDTGNAVVVAETHGSRIVVDTSDDVVSGASNA